MSDATAQSTVHRLRRIFAAQGLPKVMVTDNRPSFVGEAFEQFCGKNGIRHVSTAPYHPASNGQAERTVRTFKEAMKKLRTGDIETKVNRLLFKYRMTPHSSTGVSPSQMMLKREIRTPFHLMQPGSQSIPKAELRSDVRQFKVGESVWCKNFGQGDKWVPGVITEVKGNVNYKVSVPEKREAVHRHIDQLKARIEVTSEVRSENLESYEDLELPQTPNQSNMTPTISENPTLRRSTREVRKPAWSKDFVSH